MKRVLYYESSSGFGGSSSNLYHILRRLDKSKFKPFVIVHKQGDQFERIRSLGVEVVHIPFKELESLNSAGGFKLIFKTLLYVYPLAKKLAQYIKKHEIDLVHVNTNILLGIPMITAAHQCRKPLFCYIRESRPLIRREKYYVKWVSKFFILNHQALEMYKKDIPEHKLIVMYDGVDLEEFNNVTPVNFQNEFGIKNEKLVGLVGRIIKGKGQLEFAQAAKKVCQANKDVRFLIVGDAKGENTKYLDEVKSYVQKEGLGNQVHFTGWRTDVKEITASLDVLVLASTTFPEGLPNSIIEAMALKKPAIATDIPGPPEIIEHNKTGYIVPPGDVNEMANKILSLINNENQAVEMGIKGRARAEELFDVVKIVHKTEKLYEEELAKI